MEIEALVKYDGTKRKYLEDEERETANQTWGTP